MNQKKQKLLFFWSPQRVDLLPFFKNLSETFDLVFVCHAINEAFANEHPHGFDIRTYPSLTTPYQLLKEIQPDKVVFSAIIDFYQIAINVACQQRQIPTFVLEHGIKSEQHTLDEIGVERTKPARHLSFSRIQAPLRSLRFLFASIRLGNAFLVFSYCKFIIDFLRTNIYTALKKNRFRLRYANTYIDFAIGNIKFLNQRDGLEAADFVFIGNPFFDHFYQHQDTPDKTPDKPYYCLIDSPNEHFARYDCTIEDKRVFIRKLNTFCKKNNTRLKIKLHPLSARFPHAVEDPNIDYIVHADTLTMLVHAQGCFGFTSTLMIPAIYHKKVCLFRKFDNIILEMLTQFKNVLVLDFDHFCADDICFDRISNDPQRRERFIKYFIHKDDGKAYERLVALLTA